jgi:hypothetical protein
MLPVVTMLLLEKMSSAQQDRLGFPVGTWLCFPQDKRLGIHCYPLVPKLETS